jgi:uncharacterized protein YqjF (DUF2071 family)
MTQGDAEAHADPATADRATADRATADPATADPATADPATAEPPVLAACPYRVANPVMIQHWNTLTFLHWRFPPDAVQRLLPSGLHVEVREGSAWVGLVPFLMEVGLPRVQPIPWVSRFAETNVRTYATDDAGRSGIWFFSLDASRLGAVVVARTTYRLPYFWAAMSVQREGPIVRYHCRRRWPGPAGTTSQAVVEIGQSYRPEELSALEHFLTARWALFSAAGTRRRFALAAHDPWPLYRARAVDVADELLTAAGLPSPTGTPLAHFSPGVAVKIGLPHSEPL